MSPKHLICALLIVCVLAGCKKENDITEEPAPVNTTTEVSFTAYNGDNTGSKTMLAGGTDVWWMPGDRITIFYGNEAYAYLNTDIEEASPVAVFKGTVNGTISKNQPIWAVYPPFREFDGEHMTLTIPSTQTAVAGGFSNQTLPTIAKTTTDELYFYNICGGIKFSVTRDDIQSITFRGNNGEALAGKFKVGFGQDDRPAVTDVIDTLTTLTLVPEGSATFESGKDYYFISLPANLSMGYTIELSAEKLRGVRKSTSPVSIKRSVWGELINVDQDIEYNYFESPDNEIWYFTTDGKPVVFNNNSLSDFGAAIVSNTYVDGKGVITFDGPVTGIPSSYFYNDRTINQIILPKTIKKIGENAFLGCSNITGITLPSYLNEIGYGAFANTGLRKIELPQSLVKIGTSAFANTMLEEVHIPENVEVIGTPEFSGSEYYEYPVFTGQSLNRFTGKFSSADGRCLIVRDTLKAFAPKDLTEYTLPSGIRVLISIGSSWYVQTLHFNDELEEISASCFAWGTLSGEVILPPNLKRIGRRAFRNDSRITSVFIPESLESCGDGPFMGTLNLARFTGHHISDDGRCLILDGELVAFAQNGLTDYVIPDDVKTIRDYACSMGSMSNTTLESIEIPSGVTYIGAQSFYGYKNLTRISVKALTPPAGVPDLRISESLRIIVPASSIELYKQAWSRYSDYIISDGGQPNNEIWYTTSDGEPVVLNTRNPSYNESDFGAAIVSNTYEDGKGVITFDGTVTGIPDYAFNGCRNLSTLSLPHYVTKLGSGAFDSTSLEEVNIPESVEIIGTPQESSISGTVVISSFSNCSKLRKFSGKFASADGRCLIVRDTLKAFAPAGLEEYIIPSGVKTIGTGCSWTGVKTLHFNDELEVLCHYAFNWSNLVNVVLPDRLKTIQYGAFRCCMSLESVYIPESLENCSYGVFQQNRNLRSFTGHHISADGRCLILNGDLLAFAHYGAVNYNIPSEVKTINKYVFYFQNTDYYTLTSLEFPSGLTKIEDYAFANCTKVAKIKMNSPTPPDLFANSFVGFSSSSLTEIDVPAASLRLYQQNPEWSVYSGIMYPFSSGNSESFSVEPWN